MVTLLIPVLNEAQAMRKILPQIPKGSCDQILVVDGGSTDDSADYARSLGFDVYTQKERGLRAAYAEGIAQATGDIVVTFSPDGNSMAEKIPVLIAKMREGYDMVIVSRYKDNAKSQDDDMLTAFGNWMYTAAINFLFRAQYTDSLVMFRAYRRDILQELKMTETIRILEWGE